MYRDFEGLRPRNAALLKAIFLRQLSLYWHCKFFLLQNIAFFIISILIFKVTANNNNFETYLVFLLFSLILSFDKLLIIDHNKKILEQFLLIGVDLEIVLVAKILAHLLFIGLPLSLIHISEPTRPY